MHFHHLSQPSSSSPLLQFSDGVWVANLEDEEDLSLILTSQNPARIDVRTLRKKKVKRNFLIRSLLISVALPTKRTE